MKKILIVIMLTLLIPALGFAADGDRVIEGRTADSISTVDLDVTSVTDNNIPKMGASGFEDSALSDVGSGVVAYNSSRSITDMYHLADKRYVDEAVTALGARYYMLNTASGESDYKLCSASVSGGGEQSVSGASLSDDDYVQGWIAPNTNEPDKLLLGVYNWRIYAEKTGGTETLRLYWKLVERKNDDSEVVIATSVVSNEITSGKNSYIIPLTLSADHDVASDSYVVGKIYADVSGSGSAPSVTLYYEGDSHSHWQIPVNTEIFNNIYVNVAGDTMTGVLTVSPDGTNETFQVNDGSVGFTDGNAGTPGTLTVDASGNWSYDKSIVSTGNVAGATYGSDGSISDAELLKIDNSPSTTDIAMLELATNAEVAAFTDETRAVTPEGLGYAMAGVLAYGVAWDEDESSPTLTRTGALAGIAAGLSPGNTCLPIQASMVRVILADDGSEVYELCPTDSTKKADCSTASNLDGTDGQVMVRIDRFAYLYTYDAATHVHHWSISSVLLPGYEWHPAFYKDGAWVDHRYIGAYEGVGYDDSTSAYFDGDDPDDSPATNWPGGTAIDTANDKLGSVSGYAPLTNETRPEFRAIASNRGAGWRQQDFYLVSAIQLLYLVEYASFYSQDVIGMGRTEISGGTWAKDSKIGVTGKSNSDGNATANTGGNTNDAYMSYRGIENFYGNILKWVDGVNVNGGIPYVCNDEANYADDTTTNYIRLVDTGGSGITLPQGTDDYQTTLEQTKGGFLPSAVGGSSSTYITDYYLQSTGWRVANLGGGANSGSSAGFFSWSLGTSVLSDFPYVGSRVAY